MLYLKYEDLKVPGMTMWREYLPGYKKKVIISAWDDLVLLNPSMKIPNSSFKLDYFFEDTDSVRMVWHKRFQTIFSSTGVQVKDISMFLSSKSFVNETFRLLSKTVRFKSNKFYVLAGKTENLYMPKRNGDMIFESIETSKTSHRFRKSLISDTPACFFFSHSKLRAISRLYKECEIK